MLIISSDTQTLWLIFWYNQKSVVHSYSVKKGVFQYFANFTGNHVCRSPFLIKLQVWGSRPSTLLKKRLRHWCFPVNFPKFLKIPTCETPGDDCSYIFNEIFMTTDSYFCNYNVINSSIISFISEQKKLVLRNFLNSYHIELLHLISIYIFLSCIISCMYLLICIDLYFFMQLICILYS